jgi:hypothetical protein
MRVLILRPRIEAGGAGRVITQLARGLKSFGIQVDVASSGGQLLPGLREITTCHHLPLYPSTLQNLATSVVKLHKLVRAGGYHLLNPHHRFASAVCNLLRFLKPIPVVSTVHEIKVDSSKHFGCTNGLRG